MTDPIMRGPSSMNFKLFCIKKDDKVQVFECSDSTHGDVWRARGANIVQIIGPFKISDEPTIDKIQKTVNELEAFQHVKGDAD